MMAIEWAEKFNQRNVVICNVSSAALIIISTGITRSQQDLVYEILLANSKARQGKNVWARAHFSKLSKEATKKKTNCS